MHVVADDPSADWTDPGVYESAPGVYRIPLPLPGDGLRAVNVYAVENGDRIVLVDGGWALEESRELLRSGLAALGCELGDIERFLVTHAHRDHYTQAVTLRQEFGGWVSLGSGERPALAFAVDQSREPWEGQRAIMRRCGAHDLLAHLRPDSQQIPSQWEPPDEWIQAPSQVTVGKRALQAVPTPGHTRGHLVFRDADAELLFAGDHVLPHITPSIGFEPEPPELPLRDFLGSLRLVREMPDTRLLPAHGPVTDSVHHRVDELLEHHDVRLRKCGEVAAAGADTAYQVARRMTWTRRERAFSDLDPMNQMLAVNETEAHLDVLALQTRLRRVEIDGVRYYSVP